jgi:predicted nucleic acid-binding protein
MSDYCYLDTTVLVEALLKTLKRRRKARATVRQFGRSALPVYAIKEFKAGALDNYVLVHNKLAETKSYDKTADWLIRNRRRLNRLLTGAEALASGRSSVVGADLAEAKNHAETDRLLAEIVMLELRRMIQKAWADRRKITLDVLQELDCFSEDAPYYDDETGMIFNPHTKCSIKQDCAYAPGLRIRKSDLGALLAVIADSPRAEDVRRRAALHVLNNTPNRPFEDKMCRGLGDAYFALHCPEGATILTSNVQDHKPLAESLGHQVTGYAPEP